MGAIIFCLSVLFVVSPIIVLVSHIRKLRSTNQFRRLSVLSDLGLSELDSKRLLGFFHPYCNAGGGGERVLWTAIATIQQNEPDVVCVVYSGDIDASKQDIIDKVKARFEIELSSSTLHFVFLRSRNLVEDSTWPRFTLLGQSIGSMFLAWEAMSILIPDLYIDTMGYAFTFHIVKWLGGIPVGAYVHYPTISTDMLARVKSRQQWHTNSGAISSSPILSTAKLMYYRLFMYYYSFSLRAASFLMVNSSWTKQHIDSILSHSDPLLDLVHFLPPLVLVKFLESRTLPKEAMIVYPPCDTLKIATFSLEGRERIILSVAQFRPEKDHPAQLYSLHELFKAHPEYAGEGSEQVKLILVGGSRNQGDAARVDALRVLAKDLGIEQHVEFVVNAPYPLMLDWLSRASIGISTMVDEHFGINVVEFMAAGMIPVTHASAGPLLDIVVPSNGQPTGFHATTPKTFADALHTALTLPPAEEIAMRQRARISAVQKFSTEQFEKGWNGSGWKKWLFS